MSALLEARNVSKVFGGGLLDKRVTVALDDDVERAGGLVGQDHLRTQTDGNGNAHPLLHAATQLMRESIGHLGSETDLFEQGHHASVRLARREALVVIVHGVDDLLAHAHDGIQGVHRALSDERDGGQPQPPHLLLAYLEEVHTVEPYTSAVNLAGGTDQPHQGEGNRRFTGTRLAHETEPLIRQKPEAHAINGFHRPARSVVPNAQVRYLQDVRRHVASLSRSRPV